jgi:prephenate dehydrogenase
VNFEQITLVGVGLLGGSLGLAVKQRGLARRVVGLVRRPESIDECLALGVVDHATLDAPAAVKGSDLIIHCAPITQMRALTDAFLPDMEQGAIVTDVGSEKTNVVRNLESLIGNAGGHFVGSHPMAGGERTGVNRAKADLFQHATVVIAPTPNSDKSVIEKLTAFWTALGAKVLKTDPETHDQLVARSSHLPHVVAAALASTVLDPDLPPELSDVCGPGFRDATRIASGSPGMWRDIVIVNRENIARSLDELIRQLESVKASLSANDAEAVETFFRTAKERRDDWINSRESQDSPPQANS